MGKVKAMYAEMEKENNWLEADAYYEKKNAKLLSKLKYHNDDHMLQSEIEDYGDTRNAQYFNSQVERLSDDFTIVDNIFKNSPIGDLFNKIIIRLDEAEYKIHKLEKKV